MFDVWMIPHFLFWAGILGWLTWFFNGLRLSSALAIVGYGSIAWEAIEFGRELVLHQGHEAWLNRLVTDPVTNTAGALVGWWVVTRYQRR